MTSSTRTARAWRAGCTSTSATPSLSSASEDSRFRCGSGYAASAPGTGPTPGRWPGSSSRTWSSRPCRPGRSRCSSTCTWSGSACSTDGPGCASASSTPGTRRPWTGCGRRPGCRPGALDPVTGSDACQSRQRGSRGRRRGRAASRPRLGVLATHPIQYQAPLYQELARRGSGGPRRRLPQQRRGEPFHDPDFGVTLAWDIDLLGGYRSTELTRRPLAGKAAWLVSASRWLRRQDIVVLHGHCRSRHAARRGRVPAARRPVPAARRLAGGVVGGGPAPDRPAPGGGRPWSGTRRARCPSGERNAAFYRRYGRIPQYLAPYSVDNERFRLMADAARPARAERLASLGLDPERPTVIFSGKLIEQKRPLDLGPRHRAVRRRAQPAAARRRAAAVRHCARTSGACPCAASASSTRPSCRAGTAAGTSSPCRAAASRGDWWSTRAWPAA